MHKVHFLQLCAFIIGNILFKTTLCEIFCVKRKRGFVPVLTYKKMYMMTFLKIIIWLNKLKCNLEWSELHIRRRSFWSFVTTWLIILIQLNYTDEATLSTRTNVLCVDRTPHTNLSDNRASWFTRYFRAGGLFSQPNFSNRTRSLPGWFVAVKVVTHWT